MNKLILSGLFATAAILTPAMAGEVEDLCNAYAEENGTDNSGCSCLDEAASNDADLAAAIMSITGPEDIEALDDSAKEAIGACFPQA